MRSCHRGDARGLFAQNDAGGPAILRVTTHGPTRALSTRANNPSRLAKITEQYIAIWNRLVSNESCTLPLLMGWGVEGQGGPAV
jgi:hypothetical protein